jgi:prevent-host-death family protein
MDSLPVIVPISDLRQDTAGVVRTAVATGEPVYVTQRGRTTAVLVSRSTYERLRLSVEILGKVALGDIDVSPREGLTLDEILASGEQALAKERRLAAEERVAAERRSANEERAALRPAGTPSLEEFLTSEGLEHLVPRAASAGVRTNRQAERAW